MSANGPSTGNSNQPYPFLSDIAEIRRRARQHIMDGAVTENYAADREVVLRLLNEALATEIVCVLRYRRHYFMASGIIAEAIKDEFLKHSQEEQGRQRSGQRPREEQEQEEQWRLQRLQGLAEEEEEEV